MWALATVFIDVALRRRGPESLPDSTFLVIALVVLDLLINLLGLRVESSLTLVNVANLVVINILVLAFVFAALRFFKLERRYRQTASAMFGVDIVLTLVFIPIALVGLSLGFELGRPPFAWVTLSFFLWQIFIYGFILARALSQPLIVGLMFAILLVLTILGVWDFSTPAAN